MDSVATIFLSGIASAIGAFASSYLVKKAENLATKEDVQDIARLQEEVKAEFERLLETQRSEERLRLAVVDRRFQAHQEAFTLWLKLFHNVHSDENRAAVMECQRWWEENSLYLDSGPRAAFKKAYMAAFNHPGFLQGVRDTAAVELILDNWRDITEAGSVIEAAVNLPSLDFLDRKRPDKGELNAFGK